MPDNIGQMFYYGKTPWHEKGNEVKQPATAEEAIVAGGLDWTVGLVPIRTTENPPTAISRRLAVVRKDVAAGDPKKVLGVVHPKFYPLQNDDAVDVFDALLGRGERHYHTGGYLGNGEVIWLLARLPDDIRIAGDDVVEPYMLLTNSHDGTIAIDLRLTTVRVVCQNTLALAMRRDRSSHVFKRAHKIDPDTLEHEAKAFYQIWRTETKSLETEFQRMHATPFKVAGFARFMEQLLPTPRPPVRVATDKTIRRRHETVMQTVLETRASVVKVFTDGLQNGMTIPPAEETLWGALNAVTAFVDHQQEIKGDRYAHILFGNGATLKRKAYDLAVTTLGKN